MGILYRGSITIGTLHSILDFELAETRDRALSFFLGSGIHEVVSHFFLTNGVLKVTHRGIELTAPVL